ncbi:Uncharacterised protein [Shigella flexneri]|nr:Uncharacterised protein [Shigella flexneri]
MGKMPTVCIRSLISIFLAEVFAEVVMRSPPGNGRR